MPMRKGRETYGKKYDDAVKLYAEGKSINDIAAQLGVSYSAAYHWVKGLRKPEKGNVNDFYEFIQTNGPMPTLEIEKKFAKHNELFLMANRRGLKINRYVLPRKYKSYATWYYLEGQEKQLEERVALLLSKVKEMRDTLRDVMFKF